MSAASRPGWAWGRRLHELRRAQGLTQGGLAERAKISRTHLSELETGRSERPTRKTVERLAAALTAPEMVQEWTKVGSTAANVGSGVSHSLDAGRLSSAEFLPSNARPRRPLVEWGTCGLEATSEGVILVRGDERFETIALPDETEQEALGLIGPRGYAVRVRGQSMVNWRLRDGDIVFVNPDKGRSFGLNRPVLAKLLDSDGRDLGAVIKVLRLDEDGREYLQSDGDEGDNDVRYFHFEFLAPCVWRQPRGETLVRELPPTRGAAAERLRARGEPAEDLGQSAAS